MIKNRTKAKSDLAKEKIVLVGVLKNKRDLDLIFSERRYRIPAAQAPKQPFQYLAFYQPALFGRRGKCIRYYARVLRHQIVARREVLPQELSHPRAGEKYLWFRLGKIKILQRPIKNTAPRRISFGFSTLSRLLKSRNILELYNVAPTEEIIGKSLRRAGIKAIAQYPISNGKKRYRLDFAVFCRQGSIAVECDNKKAHSGPRQREKDKIKNAFLKRRDWIVIRLSEKDIVSDLSGCLAKIKKAIQKLGGLA